jgi:hypothetical protein
MSEQCVKSVWLCAVVIGLLAGCGSDGGSGDGMNGDGSTPSAQAGTAANASAGSGGANAMAGTHGDPGLTAGTGPMVQVPRDPGVAGGGGGNAGKSGAGGASGMNGGVGAGTGGTGASGSGGSNASGSGGSGGGGGSAMSGTIWQPMPGTSWQWQLSGSLDTSFDVEVYDIDLYETSADEIAKLHGQGRKVICYFDTAYEPGRPDTSKLEPYKGNPIDGWPGQYWVDIREAAVVDVMKARIQIAAGQKCDGIEADDVDSRSYDPVFPISASDQRGFIRELAEAAHAVGLAYGLKNDLEDVDSLLDVSDFAINEECFQYDECDALQPFVSAKKAVFQVEYTDGDLAQKGAQICPLANDLGFDTLIKHLDLDAPRFACK